VSRRTAGNDDSNTLISMNNLATLHADMGQHELAQALYEEVLAAKRRTLGDSDSSTLASIGNLGCVHMAMGNFDLALPLLEEALAGHRSADLGDNFDTFASLNNLGLCHWHISHGEFVRFGTDWPLDTVHPLCDLAELATAATLVREAVIGYGRLLGEEHPATQRATLDLEYVQQRIGEQQVQGSSGPRRKRRRRG
jgi:tetratricopeptide (TPR) repeat protein